MTLEEMQNLPKEEQKVLFEEIDKKRSMAKTVNYSALYKVGAKTLSASLNCSQKVAQGILDSYWQRNWSVKSFAESCTTKHCNAKKWVFNPLSKFWYTLRNDKDIFSVVNQSAGDYFFNLWLLDILDKRPQLTGQFHDSGVFCIKEGNREQMKAILNNSLEKINKEINLSIPIGCDCKFGKNYGFE